MHKRTITALNPNGSSTSDEAPPSSCPIPHDKPAEQSTLSKLNPLNYMFTTISQALAPNQTHHLPTTREESTIPKGSSTTTWEYPSPQQMYNALLRKGYADTDVTAVEGMVAVHNFLNEGAWEEIVGWEKRFGKGLKRGWDVCKRGEENAEKALAREERTVKEEDIVTPSLMRFQGRPKEMTPKAAAWQLLGRLHAVYATEPPFDRHDWFVSRTINGKETEVRYVIDYYSAPPEPTGEPVFYLDVRPAFTPTGAVERAMRYGGDVWWRASGGEARQNAAATGKTGWW